MTDSLGAVSMYFILNWQSHVCRAKSRSILRRVYTKIKQRCQTRIHRGLFRFDRSQGVQAMEICSHQH